MPCRKGRLFSFTASVVKTVQESLVLLSFMLDTRETWITTSIAS